MKLKKAGALVAAILLASGCGLGAESSKTATPDDPLAKVQSATLGGPSQIAPNSGAMAMCDDTKTTVVSTHGALAAPRNVITLEGGKRGKENCRVQLGISGYTVRGERLGTVVMLVTPDKAYTSELLSVGLSTQIDVPDDSALIVLTEHPGTPGRRLVHKEGEEPLGKVGEITTTDAYRQLVGTP